MTNVVHVWTWIDGETDDGSPRIARVLASGETRPEGVPDTAWRAEQDAQAWREEIMAELAAIDAKSVRPLRAGDAERIAALESQAEKLRQTLRALS